jgi:outer membrane protein assembly factor BamB
MWRRVRIFVPLAGALLSLALPACGGRELTSGGVTGIDEPVIVAADAAAIRVTQVMECCYTEGSVPHVHLEHPDGQIVFARDIAGIRMRQAIASERVPPGGYVLVSWQRPCSASCPASESGALDPARDRCQLELELAAGEALHALVEVAPGAGCTISVVDGLVTVDVPDEWALRTPMPPCGTLYLIEGEPTHSAPVDCLFAAARDGRMAELAVYGYGPGIDPVSTTVRVSETGSVEVFEEAGATGAAIGAVWTRFTCDRVIADADSERRFRLDGCGELERLSMEGSDEPAGDGVLVVLDIADGTEVGRYPIGGEQGSSPVIEGGVTFVVTAGSGPSGGLAAVSIQDGRQLWRYASQRLTGSDAPVVTGDVVLLGLWGGTVVALDPSDGRELWRLETGGESPPGLTLADGSLLVTSQGSSVQAGSVRALDPGTGRELWNVETAHPTPARAAADASHVYVVQWRDTVGTLLSLATSTGATRWEADIAGGVLGAPVVAGDAVLVGHTGAYDGPGGVAAFDVSTGARLWETQAGGDVYTTGAAADGVAVFTDVSITGADTHAFGLDLTSGRELWRVPLPVEASTPTMLPDSGVALSAGHSIVALDAKTGETRWVRQVADRSGMVLMLPSVEWAAGRMYAAVFSPPPAAE